MLTAVVVLSTWAQGAYDPFDARHQFVTKVRAYFAPEITARQRLLGTSYAGICIHML